MSRDMRGSIIYIIWGLSGLPVSKELFVFVCKVSVVQVRDKVCHYCCSEIVQGTSRARKPTIATFATNDTSFQFLRALCICILHKNTSHMSPGTRRPAASGFSLNSEFQCHLVFETQKLSAIHQARGSRRSREQRPRSPEHRG